MKPNPLRPAPPSPARIPTSPWKYLVRVARAQTARVALGFLSLSVSGSAWVLLPWVISRVIDEVVIAGTTEPLLPWTILLVVTAIASSWIFTLGYRFLFMAESHSRVRTVHELTDHLNTAGTGVSGAVSPGEMVNLSTEDAHKTGSFIFQLGFGWMGVVMLVVGTAVLWGTHPALGVTAAAGTFVIGFLVGPLLSRLQRHQIAYRSSVATLTSQAADVVGGLRVLRGIGGEDRFSERYRRASTDLREAGYTVAASDSWIQGLRTSLPLALIAGTTWVGARLALAGTITVGELSAAFGMTALLAQHAGGLIGLAQAFIAARVSSRRLTAFFKTASEIDASGTEREPGGELRDTDTGLAIEPGRLTVIVSAENEPAAAALERLARHRDSGALWGGTPMSEVDLEVLRERILLLREDYLFAQSLGATLRVDPEAALRAIEVACAGDVHSSLGSSLDGEITNGGRNLSGGQRQRLRLARAVAADAETLLAIEPTSAVDAHTESLVAERVAAERAGRTTAVATTSPLWLARADRVAWMVDGKIRATGTHAELSTEREYRSLTSRQEPR
ncbi:ABC transporter transmembrane domain-containing protein [Glycomyces xiaoerkulensis]|uniref:ABC transporter transmembrane domain-containing protein n=1 Tax=Glycomyces xiaoerkulensis TaxID=2038139 RepID=UPI001300066B|nr:ABC transporter ATP-binding protein [Glycomyces xiaoerkulensis]